MKVWYRLPAILLLSLLGSFVSPTSAAEGTSKILDWTSEGSLTLEAGKETLVQVLNRSAVDVEVRLALSWIEEDAQKAPPPEVEINPSTAPVKSGRTAVFRLKPAENTDQATYTGILLAFASPTGAPGGSIRRDVELSVPRKAPAGAGTPIRFLASEMKLRRYLVLPWSVPFGRQSCHFHRRRLFPPRPYPGFN